MIDPRFVGRTYQSDARPIDAAAVQRYAAAVGDLNPAYRAGAVPPSFAAVYCLRPPVEQLFADREVALDLAHLVHGEQRYTFLRPVRVGEVIRARGRLAELTSKRNLDFVTFETEALDAHGDPVCRGVSLFIIRQASA
jgi:acyl dehydratase